MNFLQVGFSSIALLGALRYSLLSVYCMILLVSDIAAPASKKQIGDIGKDAAIAVYFWTAFYFVSHLQITN